MHPVLHHFPCAHVGPDYDYVVRDGARTCPKCGRTLLAAGADHEAIGTSFRCEACRREFLA